ncbi:MAG: MATE family efflux transporter [Lachnospiraceae bacterium]|uniref:MATE family efflux transporter n=1 Tax=uncultured Acetatifactor sp. TaxID=1671927 RepID=UPI00262AAEBF|nr:MATE family efflux transporter [uncultured Acetatifactor sp.]MCI8787528.1 MATE family efflux transporter [Lachnospiraceae bacterium]
MTKDMTKGSPMKLILGFSIPLLFGFLFQQFYSLVDTVIVGRFLGTDNLAAVGATGSINFLIIGFCMGVCSGFSIPIAHKFGAGDYADLRRYAANCVWLSIGFAAVLTVLTAALARQILGWMKTPENIIDRSYAYIGVIFLGIPVTFLYNMTSGVIRALGDSRTPVIFLVMSSFLNVGLDLFFIVNLHLGVRGAALATVISQGISGLCCLLFIMKKFEILRIRREEWAPDRDRMRLLCGMGVPMGLQYSVTAIGSVILQSATNTLGSDAVAAVTASGRISGFLACPFDAMGSTMATYGGQNIGAGKLDRISKGLKSCILLGAGYAVIALCVSIFLGRPLAALFLDASETAIIDKVRLVMVVNTAFYFNLALVNIIRFLIQGMGFPSFAILAGVFEMIARGLAGFLLVPMLGFTGVALGSPIAWVLADAFLIPAYFHVRRVLEKRLAA